MCPRGLHLWYVVLEKCLKKTETEETMVFCHIFMIGGISIGESGPPCLPWLRL